jgi:hypothetical protein
MRGETEMIAVLKSRLISLLVVVLVLSSLMPMTGALAAEAEDEVIYADGLNPLYANNSWAQVDLGNSQTVLRGEHAIRAELQYGGAIYLYRDRVLQARDYERFELWINGGTTGGQQLKLKFYSGGVEQSEWRVNDLLPAALPAEIWVKLTIPANQISPANGLVDAISLWDDSGADQAAVYVDEIRFAGARAGGSTGEAEEPSGEGNEGEGNGPNNEEPAPGETGPGSGLPVEAVQGLAIYQDELHSQFNNYSWAEHSLTESYTVRTGDRAISMEADNGKALYLYSSWALLGKDYETLDLWVNGGSEGGQQLTLSFLSGGAPVNEYELNQVMPEGIPADTWTKISLSMSDLKLAETLFDAIVIADASQSDQSVLYIDDIVLTGKIVIPPATIEVRMDKHQMLLLPNEVQQLDAIAFYADGTEGTITNAAQWHSDRPDVVSVENGQVIGLGEGVAHITAADGLLSASAYVQVTSVETVPVYRDDVSEGFVNWSWHEKDMQNATQAHTGEYSVYFEPSGWDGVWLHGDAERKFGDYYGVEFWIHGGGVGGQDLLAHLYDGYANVGTVDLADYLPGGELAADEWQLVRINLSDFGIEDGSFTGVLVQAATDAEQAHVYIDDVSLLSNRNPGQLPVPVLAAVDVTVDVNQDRRAISNEIYGINHDDMHATQSELPFPIERWGGNNTTRYNWKLDVSNRGSDWYFMNFPNNNGELSESDQLIEEVTTRGDKVLLTVPTIGWTPKDTLIRWGFSVDKYGEQDEVEPEGYSDAGNGVRPDGSMVTGNDPLDTSMPIGPEFVTDWMQHIKDSGNTVNYYALDNEPEIWYVTHRDVHPEPPTYDEIWGFTEQYGAAIKQKDPSAQVFGPVSWGWCAYFYSSADYCSDGPDRQAHEGKPFLQWYLEQVNRYKAETGVQLVDYLDVHFYPQGSGIAEANESSSVAKQRLKALKSLYSPTYVDNSWIQEPINLIPRMKGLIDSNNPGMKLAITEYNFGNGRGITAGLAQAEALAIFGREGVDLATRFGDVLPGTPVEDAFKLYLDYDGQGSRIEGASVRSTSSNVDAVGTYAIEGADGKLYLLLFNKDTVARTAKLGSDVVAGKQAETYLFTNQERLALKVGMFSLTDDGAELALPARSATLLVLE